MDVLDTALRIGSTGVAVAAFAWSMLQYWRGARKAELDKLSGRIDTCEAKITADANDGHTSRAKVAERLTAPELSFNQVPNKESVHKLALDVAETRRWRTAPSGVVWRRSTRTPTG